MAHNPRKKSGTPYDLYRAQRNWSMYRDMSGAHTVEMSTETVRRFDTADHIRDETWMRMEDVLGRKIGQKIDQNMEERMKEYFGTFTTSKDSEKPSKSAQEIMDDIINSIRQMKGAHFESRSYYKEHITPEPLIKDLGTHDHTQESKKPRTLLLPEET